MFANQARIAYKQAFLVFCLISLFQFFFPAYSKAQVPTELPEQPIDPNLLKNASPSALQNYLKDKNQNQSSRPGEDVHRKNLLLRNENKVVKDSTLKEDTRRK